MLVALGTPTCHSLLRHLGDASDSVSSQDLEAGGDCPNGCVRTVVNAQASVVGEIDCDLRVQNLLDHIDEDVVGGAMNVVHSCTNDAGDLLYEVRGLPASFPSCIRSTQHTKLISQGSRVVMRKVFARCVKDEQTVFDFYGSCAVVLSSSPPFNRLFVLP